MSLWSRWRRAPPREVLPGTTWRVDDAPAIADISHTERPDWARVFPDGRVAPRIAPRELGPPS